MRLACVCISSTVLLNLLTCNASRHADTVQLGTRLSVDSMVPEDAIELLTVRSERNDEKMENAKKLVETLGRLPLAIDQAASYIRYTQYSFERFIQEFHTRKDILLDSDLPMFWDYKRKQKSSMDNTEIDEKLGVWTTWQLSLNLLEARNTGISLTHLLTLSAFLNGRNISQATLIPWLKYVSNSINLFPWENKRAYTGSGRFNFAQRAGDGVNKSLFEDNGSIENKFFQFVTDAHNLSLVETLTHDIRGACYSIHPIIIEWLRRRLHENDCCEYIYESIFAVETFLDQNDGQNESIEMEHEMLGHVRACFQNSAQLGETDDRLGSGKLRAAGLEMCFLLADNGMDTDTEVERILRNALNATPEYWDGNLKLLNRSPLCILGRGCFKKKELSEAAMFYEEALSLTAAGFYGDMVTLEGISTVCDIYIMLGNPKKAYSNVLDVFTNWEKCFAKDENLWDWMRLLGSFPRGELRESCPEFAIEFLKDLAALVSSNKLARSKYTQGILYNSVVYQLGRALLLCQQYDQADLSFSETLGRLLDIPRGDEAFLLTLKCSTHLSLLKRNQSKVDESEAFQRQIAELLSDQDFQGRPATETVHPSDFLTATSGLAGVGNDLKHIDEYIMALISFNYQFPGVRPGVRTGTLSDLRTQLSLAIINGEPQKEQYANSEKALRIRENLFGSADAEVIRSKETMAIYLYFFKDYEEALRLCGEILDIYLTQGHIEILPSVRSKARCLRRLCRYGEFEALKERFPENDWPAFEEEEAQLE
jgi:tetratricopeptide (TPR) repeat protein